MIVMLILSTRLSRTFQTRDVRIQGYVDLKPP
jgi:hypothetical protein